MAALTQSQMKKVQFWDDERSEGNSLIVTLNWGFRFDEDGEHVRGFDNVKEAKAGVSAARPCHCSDCQSNKI